MSPASGRFGAAPVAVWRCHFRDGEVMPALAWPRSERSERLGLTPREWPSMRLIDALTRRHSADSWFQCVTWEGKTRWQRLAKAILADMPFMEPELAYIGVDLDRPDHRTDPWRSSAEAAEAVRKTAHLLGCAVYATRGGLRAVYALERPCPLPLAQSLITRSLAALPATLPVSIDRGVKDWTRGFRLPWCPRADGKIPAWGQDAPPMELTPLRDGAVLRYDAAQLVDEQAPRRVSSVTFTPPGPGSDENERRIGLWLRGQLDELRAAPSRHGVLLAKARALGGVCAGAATLAERPGAVDAEPFLRALVDAAGNSNNAATSARSAFAVGSGSPWWFEVQRAPIRRGPARLEGVRDHLDAPPIDEVPRGFRVRGGAR